MDRIHRCTYARMQQLRTLPNRVPQRAVSASESPDWTLGPYIAQTLLLLIAPALYAASIYMILGRIILVTDGEAHSLIPKRWLTKIFVAGDVASFLLQGAGQSSASLCGYENQSVLTKD